MTTVCWTILHHAGTPVAHATARLVRLARRLVGRLGHRAATAVHHAPAIAVRPRSWIELVCKAIPAVVAGAGLLVPHPASPPVHLPEQPPAIIDPGPAFPPWSPPIWIGPPAVVPPGMTERFSWPPPLPPVPELAAVSAPVSTPLVVAAPEPATIGLLLDGAAALLLVLALWRRSPPSCAAELPQTGPSQGYALLRALRRSRPNAPPAGDDLRSQHSEADLAGTNGLPSA